MVKPAKPQLPPHPATVVQASRRPAHLATVVTPAARLDNAVTTRPRHAATLTVVQRMDGGKGGLDYGSISRAYSQDEIEVALGDVKIVGVKGHGKGHRGSKVSGQTEKETKLVVDALRANRQKAKEEKRPKAQIHGQAPMSAFEKAKAKAKALKREEREAGHDSGWAVTELSEYLEKRPGVLTSEEEDLVWAVVTKV